LGRSTWETAFSNGGGDPSHRTTPTLKKAATLLNIPVTKKIQLIPAYLREQVSLARTFAKSFTAAPRQLRLFSLREPSSERSGSSYVENKRRSSIANAACVMIGRTGKTSNTSIHTATTTPSPWIDAMTLPVLPTAIPPSHHLRNPTIAPRQPPMPKAPDPHQPPPQQPPPPPAAAPNTTTNGLPSHPPPPPRGQPPTSTPQPSTSPTRTPPASSCTAPTSKTCPNGTRSPSSRRRSERARRSRRPRPALP